jgi:hypothetical protein
MKAHVAGVPVEKSRCPLAGGAGHGLLLASRNVVERV